MALGISKSSNEVVSLKLLLCARVFSSILQCKGLFKLKSVISREQVFKLKSDDLQQQQQ